MHPFNIHTVLKLTKKYQLITDYVFDHDDYCCLTDNNPDDFAGKMIINLAHYYTPIPLTICSFNYKTKPNSEGVIWIFKFNANKKPIKIDVDSSNFPESLCTAISKFVDQKKDQLIKRADKYYAEKFDYQFWAELKATSLAPEWFEAFQDSQCSTFESQIITAIQDTLDNPLNKYNELDWLEAKEQKNFIKLKSEDALKQYVLEMYKRLKAVITKYYHSFDSKGKFLWTEDLDKFTPESDTFKNFVSGYSFYQECPDKKKTIRAIDFFKADDGYLVIKTKQRFCMTLLDMEDPPLDVFKEMRDIDKAEFILLNDHLKDIADYTKINLTMLSKYKNDLSHLVKASYPTIYKLNQYYDRFYN